MKYTTMVIVCAALLLPIVGAAPNAQTGTQTGSFWSSSTFVAAQGGSNFLLAGAIGDHDVFFYDAGGRFVGGSIACGPDQGTVPGSAVLAQILIWDQGSVPGTCVATPVSPGSSTFVYVDGF